MTAEVRRKNLGKQFALVHIDSRVVFSWHRPGEALPKRVDYLGETYILTQEAVDYAQKHQRAPLEVATAKHLPIERAIGPKYEVAPITWKNPKGGVETQLIDNWKNLREKAKAMALYGSAVTAAALSSWAVVDTVKGFL